MSSSSYYNSKATRKLNREANRDIHHNAKGYVDKAGWSSLKKPKAPLTPEQQLQKQKKKASYLAGAVWLTIWAIIVAVLSVWVF